jgi:hypothetical protein
MKMMHPAHPNFKVNDGASYGTKGSPMRRRKAAIALLLFGLAVALPAIP